MKERPRDCIPAATLEEFAREEHPFEERPRPCGIEPGSLRIGHFHRLEAGERDRTATREEAARWLQADVAEAMDKVIDALGRHGLCGQAARAARQWDEGFVHLKFAALADAVLGLRTAPARTVLDPVMRAWCRYGWTAGGQALREAASGWDWAPDRMERNCVWASGRKRLQRVRRAA